MENYSALRKCCQRDKETEIERERERENVGGCECVWYHITERKGERERENPTKQKLGKYLNVRDWSMSSYVCLRNDRQKKIGTLCVCVCVCVCVVA